MVGDGFYIRIPFSVFLWGFRRTQRFHDFFHLHAEYQSVRIPFNRINQFPVFFPVQGFRHVIRSAFGPSHSPVLHPQSDRGTVLVLLDSHIFIDDPFPCFRKFYPLLWSSIFVTFRSKNSLCMSCFKWRLPTIIRMGTDMIIPYAHISPDCFIQTFRTGKTVRID